MKSTLSNICIISLLFGLLGAGCQDENETNSAVAKITTDMIGKWKLTSAIKPQIADTVSYAANNILFHFQEDKTVMITADVVDYIGPDPGQYSYEIFPSDYEGFYNITLDFFSRERETFCKILGNELTINDSPLDGHIFQFIRAQ